MKIPDVLDLNEVLIITGFPRSTLYHYINTNSFPSPKKLGLRKVRWSKKEIFDWFKNKGFDIKE